MAAARAGLHLTHPGAASGLGQVLGQMRAIDLLVGIREEQVLPPFAAMDNMVGNIRKYKSCEACHGTGQTENHEGEQ